VDDVAFLGIGPELEYLFERGRFSPPLESVLKAKRARVEIEPFGPQDRLDQLERATRTMGAKDLARVGMMLVRRGLLD